ncbi:hypothetical protein SMD44_p10267 (plasmid) [Streptomyces alboflavus]|uniref:Uncharacterized protein n=1 Tax=Streptomyces alboflavus TaxID=67267 RepID=A0A291W534_9ACTN|nr:hypothetical protein [Streptomyces alboflavus]ATM24766.1 hypothetical protein SMD44_p10267 [Streptomyces alboflavus]
MTHHPTRRRQSGGRLLLPDGLRWLVAGDDHRLARTRYGTRESATERARRREQTAALMRRQRQVRRAARRGQHWEESQYTPATSRRFPAAAPASRPATARPAASSDSTPAVPHERSLPALPPGFTPADLHGPQQQCSALAQAEPAKSADQPHDTRRPDLYVIAGTAPAPQAAVRRRRTGQPATPTAKAGRR